MAVPARAHGLLIDPLNRNRVIVVARRPGDYLLSFDLRDHNRVQQERIDDDRVFNGHAAFSADGNILYTTENRSSDGRGVVGVRDAATLRKFAELDSHGIDPHALLVEPSGTLLVANGGLLTLPMTGRIELNAGHIDSSLVRLDARDGSLLGQWRLDDANLSIRHLAASPRQRGVGIALQSQHREPKQRAAAPVFALFDGSSLRAVSASARLLGGYGGDVASVRLARRSYFAVSCTHADRVAIWDEAGRWVGTVPLPHACALAPFGEHLFATGDHGDIACIRETRAVSGLATPLKWDNHAVVLAA